MRWAPPAGAFAALALAATLVGCARTLSMPSSIANAVEGAGLHLEVAWLGDAPISRDLAVSTAEHAIDANEIGARLTGVDLVTVSGPGNPRLGWDPADDSLVYAVQWTAGSTVGLLLLSARSGEVLFNTAY